MNWEPVTGFEFFPCNCARLLCHTVLGKILCPCGARFKVSKGNCGKLFIEEIKEDA